MRTKRPEDLIRPEKPRERRLVYHYSPRRSLLISFIVISILAAAGLFIFKNVPTVKFVAGVFALGLIISLRRECSVRIWVDWPYVIYEYHSIFRHFREYIAPWDISGLTPDIVSMWRGNISERYVMNVRKRELVITPFYSEGDRKIYELEGELNRLPESRKQAEKELEEEHRELHPEEYPEEKPEVVDIWGFFEMGIQCPRCDGPLAVNGPYTDLVCPQCSEDIEMDPSIWSDLLEDIPQEIAEDYEEGTGSKSTIWGTYDTTLLYGRMKPYCPECKRDFDVEKDKRKDDRIFCSECGESLSIMEPPDWWTRIFREAFLIVGAEKPSEESNLEGDPDKGPVVFTCEKCGAAINIDGSSRNITCEHCGGPVYIPDDLWLRFHPPDSKKRWFFGYRWDSYSCEDEEE